MKDYAGVIDERHLRNLALTFSLHGGLSAPRPGICSHRCRPSINRQQRNISAHSFAEKFSNHLRYKKAETHGTSKSACWYHAFSILAISSVPPWLHLQYAPWRVQNSVKILHGPCIGGFCTVPWTHSMPRRNRVVFFFFLASTQLDPCTVLLGNPCAIYISVPSVRKASCP